mmetsp:Transcript_13313/g.34025  ORF Transcript_13313/g.34025 Transcript_13313/m.34025 type:complete len:214 (-) Transcript_13313:3785-4426(-)
MQDPRALQEKGAIMTARTVPTGRTVFLVLTVAREVAVPRARRASVDQTAAMASMEYLARLDHQARRVMQVTLVPPARMAAMEVAEIRVSTGFQASMALMASMHKTVHLAMLAPRAIMAARAIPARPAIQALVADEGTPVQKGLRGAVAVLVAQALRVTAGGLEHRVTPGRTEPLGWTVVMVPMVHRDPRVSKETIATVLMVKRGSRGTKATAV